MDTRTVIVIIVVVALDIAAPVGGSRLLRDVVYELSLLAIGDCGEGSLSIENVSENSPLLLGERRGEFNLEMEDKVTTDGATSLLSGHTLALDNPSKAGVDALAGSDLNINESSVEVLNR